MNQTIPTPGAACTSCAAPLSELVLGGVGDWRNKVLCLKCMHLQDNVRPQDMARLVSLQYGISERDAQAADSRSQEEYESVTLGGQPHGDLPGVPPTTRWHARRLAFSTPNR